MDPMPRDEKEVGDGEGTDKHQPRAGSQKGYYRMLPDLFDRRAPQSSPHTSGSSLKLLPPASSC